ncbi:hypothetical protein AAC387_Pa05g1175 [Persea americana]
MKHYFSLKDALPTAFAVPLDPPANPTSTASLSIPPSSTPPALGSPANVPTPPSFVASSLIATPDLLSTSSKVLCISTSAGHQILALSSLGVGEVTGVETVDSPLLVERADPHNLPFFDGIFDLALSAHLHEAMFPNWYAREMERTVRKGEACMVVVD